MKNKGDKMKAKKVLIAVLCVILIGAVGAVAYLALNNGENKTTTTSTTQTQATEAQTTASLAGSIVNSTTAKTTQATTADKYAFIREGVWYLADADNEDCLAIKFKKGGEADIAYFNSDNIEGFDAQYFKGTGSYDTRKGTIIFSKLPEVCGKTNLELVIKGSDIYCNSKKLKHYSTISLDNALKCFE